jgi:hypothetical protein
LSSLLSLYLLSTPSKATQSNAQNVSPQEQSPISIPSLPQIPTSSQATYTLYEFHPTQTISPITTILISQAHLESTYTSLQIKHITTYTSLPTPPKPTSHVKIWHSTLAPTTTTLR